MKVFSEEWAKNFCELINSSPAYKSAAQDWIWPLILTMSNDDNQLSIFLDLKEGTCSNARQASVEDFETAEFIISASSESWQKILNSELDPMMAVMTKKLELKKGNVGVLVRNVNAAKELIKIATTIKTEF